MRITAAMLIVAAVTFTVRWATTRRPPPSPRNPWHVNGKFAPMGYQLPDHEDE